jgi:hypothetical protein
MRRAIVDDFRRLHMTKLLFVAAASAAALVCVMAGPAHASTLTCDKVAPDYFEIDGLLDDWKGHRGHRAGGKAADASFDLRCAYDDKRLYLSVDVRDDIMLRTGKARAGKEDNVLIELKVGRKSAPVSLRAFPGAQAGKTRHRPKRLWGNRAAPKWLAVEDSLQKAGFSVEAAIPLGKIPGFGSGTPGLKARVTFADGDVYGKKVDKTPQFRGTLELEGGRAMLEAFLNQVGASRGDVKLDVMVDVNGKPGAERVLWIGNVVGVLSNSYHYLTLPVPRSDVLSVKVVDLEGSGRGYIIADYHERGNGGARNVVGVWYFTGAAFDRVLAFECKKQQGGKTLVNRYSFVKRGAHRARKSRIRGKGGYDLLVEATEATGWDEDNYFEQPATDVNPILLPWEDETSMVYWFEKGSVFNGPAKAK